MNVILIDCPVCGHKISSQANACPQCGQPIHPEKGKNEQHPPALFVPLETPLNLAGGISTSVGVLILCFLIFKNMASLADDSVLNDEAATFGLLISILLYLAVWAVHIYRELRDNNIPKLLLLIFIPVLGIIFSAFLWKQPENQEKK